MCNIWDLQYNEHVTITLDKESTCSVCKSKIQPGTYYAIVGGYCMITVEGAEVVAREFNFSVSPCLCDTCRLNKYDADLTQFAEVARTLLITYYQEYAYDAERKLPFPENIEIRDQYKRYIEYTKTAKHAGIMNAYMHLKDYCT